MDIRNSLEGLKSILGTTPAAPSASPSESAAKPGGSALGSDHATLSSAGSEVSLTASGSDVRKEKVAAVQSLLAAGTYSVPASAVASKVVDALLGSE